jgi:hypothetical protein
MTRIIDRYLGGKDTSNLACNALDSSPKRIIQVIKGNTLRKPLRKHEIEEA